MRRSCGDPSEMLSGVLARRSGRCSALASTGACMKVLSGMAEDLVTSCVLL